MMYEPDHLIDSNSVEQDSNTFVWNLQPHFCISTDWPHRIQTTHKLNEGFSLGFNLINGFLLKLRK